MMTHSMKLDEKYFNEVRFGRKWVEIRLNDEKRKVIQVGDCIEFSNGSQNLDTVRAVVKGKKSFCDLRDLLLAYDITAFGSVWRSVDEALKEITYYSSEDIREHGVIALEIRLLPQP